MAIRFNLTGLVPSIKACVWETLLSVVNCVTGRNWPYLLQQLHHNKLSFESNRNRLAFNFFPKSDGDKPIRNFLDDPRRSGPAPDTDRKEGSRRHVRNWGGLDFDNVKTGAELEKEWTVSNLLALVCNNKGLTSTLFLSLDHSYLYTSYCS